MIAGGYLLGRRNNTIDPGAEPVVGRKLLVILGGARIPIPNELAIVDRHFADYPLRGGDAATGCVAISELTAQDVPHGDIGAGTNAQVTKLGPMNHLRWIPGGSQHYLF